MFGQTFEENKIVKAGINDCTIESFGYNPNAGKGGSPLDAYDLKLKIGAISVNKRIFAPKKDDPYRRTIKNSLTGKEEKESKEAALKRAFGNFNSEIKMIVEAFGVTNFKEVMAEKKPTTIKEFNEVLASLIPEGYMEKEYQCILGYDGNGYLKLPKALWVTGRYLKAKDQDVELTISDKVQLKKEDDEDEDNSSEADYGWAN